MRTLPDLLGADAVVGLGAPAGAGAFWIQFVLTGDGQVRIGDLSTSVSCGILVTAPHGLLLPYVSGGSYALDLLRIYIPAGLTVSIEYEEAAAPPPPVPELGEIRVTINGGDFTRYLYYQSQIQWSLMRGSRGACTIPFIIPPDDSFGASCGDTIEIFDPHTVRVWSGTIDGLEITWIGDDGWHVLTVIGVSLEQLFDTAQVGNINYDSAVAVGTLLAGFTAGDVVRDLLTRSGVTAVTAGMISAGPTVAGLQVSNIATGFADLALLAGFVWYIDPSDNTLNFHSPTARASSLTITSDHVVFETLDWKQSRADFRDTQVVQLPGVAQTEKTETFSGDGSQTAFVLTAVPAYIINISIAPMGRTGSTITWEPASKTVTITPALPNTATITVVYADSLTTIAAANSIGSQIGIGSKSLRYSGTRMFTRDGALQQADALLARYSMLPSTLQFQTDMPGVQIARALPLNLDSPLEAGALLNGTWMVLEITATIVPGLDQRAEPWGHFRYTIYLINTASSAIFQGDATTSIFLLPIVPSAVTSMIVTNARGVAYSTSWAPGTDQITVTPALAAGAGLTVGYRGPNAPDVPTFLQTWENLPGGGGSNSGASPVPDSSAIPGPPPVFVRTLLLRDLTAADDVADHVPVYHSGTGLRLMGVLRKTISADLTVRINKKPVGLATVELITVTIPSGTPVDDVIDWSLASGSPATLPPFLDNEVLSADILESDGSSDVNGIASFTVEWELES